MWHIASIAAEGKRCLEGDHDETVGPEIRTLKFRYKSRTQAG